MNRSYIVLDEEQDWVFDDFDVARAKALELGYNTMRDNYGEIYYF
jgi:hypothetical protein